MRASRLFWLLFMSCASTFAGCSDTSEAEPTAAEPLHGRDRSSGGAMWGASFFPNIPLVTHRGEHVRFFDLIKDKVVAINFIYTKCADTCPMETARMLEVQKLLGDRVGKDVFFFSISIDPENDTPEALAAYTKVWKIGPGWTFLTGKEEDITHLRKKLGVYDADLKRTDHRLNLLLGNQKTGRWMKRSPNENPYILATQLGSWLHNWKLPGASDRDYADAPAIRNISDGEQLFRARCAACHTVGGGDRNDVEERRVGPDLLHVTKHRDPAWLERWIMEPDRMLAEKDPLATALAAQYGGIAMPNLRMAKNDVEIVLRYIEEESLGVERRAQAAGEEAAGDEGAGEKVTASGDAAAALAVGALPESAVGLVRNALESYEAMRAGLAADDLPLAKSHAASFAETAKKASTEAHAARQALLETAEAARALGVAEDIATARLSFGDVSKRVIALMIGHPSLQEGRFLFLCSMASGYQKWVQTSPTLKNPYWGARMLTCGTELTTWAI